MRSHAGLVPRIGFLALLAAASLFVNLHAARAQETIFTFNPSATTLHFTLGATLHTVHGTMRLKSGAIRFNAATGTASGEVVVDATSAETGNQSRDKKMHREVLQSARYPRIVFNAQHVSGALKPGGSSQLQLSGTFELDGRAHPMTLPVSIDREPNAEVRAKAVFAIPYIQWGLKNPSTLFLRVSDHVDMEIDAVGQLKPAN